MIPVSISKKLQEKLPLLRLSCIESNVITEDKNEELWNMICHKVADIARNVKTDQINKIPAIAYSRKAYKICGKDPARYRPSAEALMRRAVKQKDIFQINNVVDLLNLVSLSTGFSIGGYDAEKISGNVIFDIGSADEDYEGIGRGRLNIEHLPVFRDEKGPFGSPTSDSVRTSVTIETNRFLMILIDFGSSEELVKATDMAVDLSEFYAKAIDLQTQTISICNKG
jgi:DNA/RNA-binding domain of Phe-tRNA-synthetase-like protein